MLRRLSQQSDVRFPGITQQNAKRRSGSYCYTLAEDELRGLEEDETQHDTLSAPPDIGLVEETTSVRFKVIVLGDEQCGKTSLLYSFSRKSFESDHPVVFEDDIITLRFGTKTVQLLLIDLSGLGEYEGFRCELYKDTDLFIVCFDIGNPQSLENVQEVWIPEIAREEPHAPFILVGCKNDLRSDSALTSELDQIEEQYEKFGEIEKTINETAVTRQLAEKVGLDWGGREYIECCARTGYQTSEVFHVAAQLLLCYHGDEKNQHAGGALRGLSRFARRKSSDITGRFNGLPDSFSSASKKRTHRRKSLGYCEQGRKIGVIADSRLLGLPPQPVYNNKHRRSSAFA